MWSAHRCRLLTEVTLTFRPKRKYVHNVRCPECGVAMIERTSPRGTFYGCARFPVCVGLRPAGGDGEDSYTLLLRAAAR